MNLSCDSMDPIPNATHFAQFPNFSKALEDTGEFVPAEHMIFADGSLDDSHFCSQCGGKKTSCCSKIDELAMTISALRDEAVALREEKGQLRSALLELKTGVTNAEKLDNFQQQAELDLSFDLEHASTEDFKEDLMQFLKVVSERFHVKAYILELVGQSIYSLFGFFSVVVLVCFYGLVGLRNRGFIAGGLNWCLFMSNIQSSCLGIAICIWLYGCFDEVSGAEITSLFLFIWLRNSTIAIKYAYMTSESYRELNECVLPGEYMRDQLLIMRWDIVSKRTAEKYINISCITVLGTQNMRSSLCLCFLPWPRTSQDASWLRTRVDKTTKRLLLIPTGRISMTSFIQRRAEAGS